MKVRYKKSLGQHFLRDSGIAGKIAGSLTGHGGYTSVLEIGPGRGILTRKLLERGDFHIKAIEIDETLAAMLESELPRMKGSIIRGDFLHFDLASPGRTAVIGNFPYNISSQILFKVIENRDMVPELVGMFQKEVAARITGPSGSKDYGILSVLTQAYYRPEYLFDVKPGSFFPPPRVMSGVIRLRRLDKDPACSYAALSRTVKAAFHTRRKILKNALGSLFGDKEIKPGLLSLRAEQLGVADFVYLACLLESND